MVQTSWISPIDVNVTKPRLEEQNSLVPNCKMIITIRYHYSIWGTWPRWSQQDKGLLSKYQIKPILVGLLTIFIKIFTTYCYWCAWSESLYTVIVAFLFQQKYMLSVTFSIRSRLFLCKSLFKCKNVKLWQVSRKCKRSRAIKKQCPQVFDSVEPHHQKTSLKY